MLHELEFYIILSLPLWVLVIWMNNAKINFNNFFDYVEVKEALN